jgi:hypothetical protein
MLNPSDRAIARRPKAIGQLQFLRVLAQKTEDWQNAINWVPAAGIRILDMQSYDCYKKYAALSVAKDAVSGH